MISDFNSAFSICFLMNLLDPPPSLLLVQFAVLYFEIRTFIYWIRKSKSYFKKDFIWDLQNWIMFNLLFLHQFQINIEKLFMHCSKCSFLFHNSKTGQIQHCATAPFYSYFFLNHQRKESLVWNRKQNKLCLWWIAVCFSF